MGEFVALIDVVPEDIDVNFEEFVSNTTSSIWFKKSEGSC